jgi:DNA-binding GntR family transcriptional regulator
VSASAERAYEHIKAAILSGRYRNGERLTEDMLAGEMGLSRTPIRDALRRLQADQLITVTPYSGARVASWSQSELDEIALMRVMLESFAARLAAGKRSEAHLDRMRAACARMEHEARKDRPDLAIISAENLALHEAIVEAADNTRLAASIRPLWDLPLIVRKYRLFGPERLNRSLWHHREIVTAIASQDPEWAESIMRVHIQAARAFDSALARDEGEPLPDLPGVPPRQRAPDPEQPPA